jgi:hypothetical protein
MNRILVFLLLCSVPCFAAEPLVYDVCVQYAYSNYSPRVPFDFAFSYGTNGLYISTWTLPVPKPTLAELDSIKTNALAWKSQQTWDYANWSDRERRMLTLLVQEINILRVKVGLPSRTKEQIINALKDQ